MKLGPNLSQGAFSLRGIVRITLAVQVGIKHSWIILCFRKGKWPFVSLRGVMAVQIYLKIKLTGTKHQVYKNMWENFIFS